jgi:NAD(P)-dependent dehydrogenase (short-subunit alcohol dehydrogenase family)
LPGRWVYPATKAALEQLTRSAAMDLAADGIRVNSVLPGWTEKPWHLTATDEIKAHYKKWGGRLHMLDRQGTLPEVANVVMFLCSEYAGFVTGACYCVDGGHSAMGPQGRAQILPTAIRKAASGATRSAK